jgi:hypothetical protein
VNAPDPLGEFFVTTPRRSAGLSGRGGLHGQVDLILEQLRLPATLDADGDWHLDSDVGPFLLVLDEGGELVLIQKLGEVEDGLEDSAVGMNFLLRMNFEARGACFAMIEDDEDGELFVLTARLPAGDITREAVERLLADGMRLSRRLEELVEEPEPAADESFVAATTSATTNTTASATTTTGSAPADWYPDPKGEARLRYWDGSVWTDHTAA